MVSMDTPATPLTALLLVALGTTAATAVTLVLLALVAPGFGDPVMGRESINRAGKSMPTTSGAPAGHFLRPWTLDYG